MKGKQVQGLSLPRKELWAMSATLLCAILLCRSNRLDHRTSVDATASEYATELERDITRTGELIEPLVEQIAVQHETIVRAERECELLRGESEGLASELAALEVKLYELRGSATLTKETALELRRVFASVLSRENLLAAKQRLLQQREAALAHARSDHEGSIRTVRSQLEALAQFERRTKELRERWPIHARVTSANAMHTPAELEQLLREMRLHLLVTERTTDALALVSPSMEFGELPDHALLRAIDRYSSRKLPSRAPLVAGEADSAGRRRHALPERRAP